MRSHRSIWCHVPYDARRASAAVLAAVASPDQADLVLRIEVGRRKTAAPPPTGMVGPSPREPGTPDYLPIAPPYLPVAPPFHGYLDQEGQELVEGAGPSRELSGVERSLLRLRKRDS